MATETVERWPVDYDSLEKGSVIPVSRIEQIVGVKQYTSAYDFALLKLKGRIERELHDRGRLWTLRTEKGAIKILTDPEASAYNHQQQIDARSTARRRFTLLSAVDVTVLDNDQKREHERNMEIDGKYLQAQQAVASSLRLTANVRAVPGLPDAK